MRACLQMDLQDALAVATQSSDNESEDNETDESKAIAITIDDGAASKKEHSEDADIMAASGPSRLASLFASADREKTMQRNLHRRTLSSPMPPEDTFALTATQPALSPSGSSSALNQDPDGAKRRSSMPVSLQAPSANATASPAGVSPSMRRKGSVFGTLDEYEKRDTPHTSPPGLSRMLSGSAKESMSAAANTDNDSKGAMNGRSIMHRKSSVFLNYAFPRRGSQPFMDRESRRQLRSHSSLKAATLVGTGRGTGLGARELTYATRRLGEHEL